MLSCSLPGLPSAMAWSRVRPKAARFSSIRPKRARTTLTYLAVATLGTEQDKKRYRKAVNGAHAAVRSSPDSPVAYNAFDPRLQLWVAACLYKGVEDTGPCLPRPLDADVMERI